MPHTRRLNLSAGHVLFRLGEVCPGLVVLDSGSVRVTLTTAGGREIVLYRVGPGQICLQTFACLQTGNRYSAEGVAETALEGELIPPGEVDARMAGDPAFRTRFLAAVADRFAEFEGLVEHVMLGGLEVRVARSLLRLAGEDGVVRASHETLAAEAGSARAAISRQMAAFARTGLVTQGRGRITLKDVAGLEHIAAGKR